jgi:hypothetical protein
MLILSWNGLIFYAQHVPTFSINIRSQIESKWAITGSWERRSIVFQ